MRAYCDICTEPFMYNPDDYEDGDEPELCPTCQQRVDELEGYFETRNRRSDG